jgi:hypothetical protein
MILSKTFSPCYFKEILSVAGELPLSVRDVEVMR